MADKMVHTENSVVVYDVSVRHTEDNTHPRRDTRRQSMYL